MSSRTPPSAAHRLRAALNVLNLSTPAGLLIAALGGATVRRGPDGLLLGYGYRLRLPPAPAFTVGNVILVRGGPDVFTRRPELLAHESRHATQYAWCLGVLMWIPYLLAAGFSWATAGDPATRNVFERRAGLADGGYRCPAPRDDLSG